MQIAAENMATHIWDFHVAFYDVKKVILIGVGFAGGGITHLVTARRKLSFTVQCII